MEQLLTFIGKVLLREAHALVEVGEFPQLTLFPSERPMVRRLIMRVLQLLGNSVSWGRSLMFAAEKITNTSIAAISQFMVPGDT